MPDPTTEFFEYLSTHRHQRLLEEVEGTLRFDLTHEHGTDIWYVAIKDGDVRVSKDVLPADCIVHTTRAVFDRFVTGQQQPLPLWLRREFWVEGNPVMMRLFDRIFPGLPTARDPRDIARARRRQ